MIDRSFQNPMKDVQGFFKKGERKRIYLACQSTRDKVLIRLLWKSGRRIGEILQLKVSEIDFENKLINWHIEKKRTDTFKPKPIDEFTLKLLSYFINYEHLTLHDYIFRSPVNDDRPISRQRAFQIVRRSCKEAGVERVGNKLPHPHHFRHSMAIDLAKKAKSPADIRKIQMFLEHASLGMTEHYLQFGNDDLRSLIEEQESD